MENPLSQKEIDALMQTLLASSSGDDLFQTRDTTVRHYDFRRPGKFKKDMLRALVMIHENYARLLQTFLATSLRTRVQVAVRSTNQYPYAEFAQLLPNPAVVTTFGLAPLPGTCLLELSQNIAFAIVDRVFGGGGSDSQPQRALSEIELGVVRRMMADAFTPLQEAWRNIAEISPTLQSLETNPMFLQTAPPSEVLATITIGVQIGEHMGHMTLAFPYSTVEPVLARLSSQNWLTAGRSSGPETQEAMQHSVQEASIRVRVYLGRNRMSIGEFTALKLGDVIPLDSQVTGDIPVCVGNRVTFYGKVGLVQNRIAVQVTRHAYGKSR